MSACLKIANRSTYRTIFKHLQLQNNRAISTYHKFKYYPSLSIQSNFNTNSFYQSQSYRFTSTAQSAEDKNEVLTEQEESDGSDKDDALIESDDESEEIASLNQQIESLETELKKYKDGLSRSHADLINLQNMSKKDVTNARNFAIKNFSKDMLSVADALQSCLGIIETHIDDYMTQTNDENINNHVKAVVDGIKLTQNTLLKTFERHGIKKVTSLKKEFDPNVHEALFKGPSNDVEEDCIYQVVAEGYTIKDAVLRAAKVGVSTGPQPDTDTDTQKQSDSETETETETKTDDNDKKE